MGKEFVVSSLEELCDLMCNNRLPEDKLKESFEAEDKEWGTMEERLKVIECKNKHQRETCENCKYDRKECGNDDHYGFCNNWELKKKKMEDKE